LAFSGSVTRIARISMGAVAAIAATALGAWLLAVALPSDDRLDQLYPFVEYPHGTVRLEVPTPDEGDVRALFPEIIAVPGGNAVRDVECPCGTACLREPRVLEGNRRYTFDWDGLLSDCSSAPAGTYQIVLKLEDGTFLEGSRFHYGRWN
jgi:hypothetical protein